MIIVYGGAFNPPTKAHYEIIKIVNDIFKPEAFILLPVGNKYQKKELISFDHRVKMLELMGEKLPFVTISKLEENESFKGTVNTLDQLKKQYENQKLVLLIGADQYDDLNQWIEYERLIKDYEFIVISRPNYLMNVNQYDDLMIKARFIQYESVISSTQIRKNVDEYQNDLLEEVYQYIKKENLYSR